MINNIKFSEYSIDLIKEHIDNKLYLKLKRFNIFCIKDLLEIDIENFFKHQKGVGKNSVTLLIQLKEYIINNEDRLLNHIKGKTEITTLPKNNSELNFLIQISSVVSEFCSFLKKPEYKLIVEKYYGISGGKKLDYQDLAVLFNYSAERIRQLQKNHLKEIQRFFENGADEEKKIRIHPDILSSISKIKEDFQNKGCVVLDDFKGYLKLNFNLLINDTYSNELDLLFDIIGFNTYGKMETSFTESRLFSTDIKTHKTFPRIGKIAISFLKAKCIEISEEELIIRIKKSIGNFENYHIINFLKRLPEIETLEMDGENRFQIKFHLLSRASDKAFRILSIKGEQMYIDDIVNEINREQSKYGLKIYNRESLTLPGDKRFKPFGKTGYWTLKEDTKSTDFIIKLILRALYRLDKPSTLNQIFYEVKKERKNVNKKSIHILLLKICHKTIDGNYILKDWKSKYPELIIKSNRKTVKKTSPPYHRVRQLEDIIHYLKQKSKNREYASKLIKILGQKDEKYTKQSFYKLFENESYFKRIKEQNSLMIMLKESINVFDSEDVFEIISKGENSFCEFKETLRFCLSEQKKMKYIEEGVLKTIAAFLNSSGGDLFIGVNDKSEIKGLELDYQTFKDEDKNRDGFLKHLDNLIGKTFTNSIFPLLKIKIYEKDGIEFCRIHVKPKKGNGVFVSFNKEEELFFIRRSSSTVSLDKKQIINYIQNIK